MCVNKLLTSQIQQDTPTPRSCWAQGKNVIVSYDYPIGQHPEMWGRIQYFYGNSMDPIKVEKKLQHDLEKPKPKQGEHFLKVLMVVDTLDSIFVKVEKKRFGVNRLDVKNFLSVNSVTAWC